VGTTPRYQAITKTPGSWIFSRFFSNILAGFSGAAPI
jgi:hypothetical protein